MAEVDAEARRIVRELRCLKPWRLNPDGSLACFCCGGIAAHGHRPGCVWLAAWHLVFRLNEEVPRAG